MDPISALGIAAAVVSFVDFSLSILKAGRSNRESDRDLTSHEFFAATRVFADLNATLKTKTRTARDSNAVAGSGTDGFSEALEECSKIADRLAKELGAIEVQVKESEKKKKKLENKWRTFRAALEERVFKKDEIKELVDKLERYQQLVVLETLTCINENQNFLATQQAKKSDRMERNVTEIMMLTQTSVQSMEQILRQIQSAVDISNFRLKAQHDVIEAFLTFNDKETKMVSNQPMVASPTNMKTIRITSPHNDRDFVQNAFPGGDNDEQHPVLDLQHSPVYFSKILDCLFYRHINDRFEFIPPPYKETFKWIWTSSAAPERSWSSLTDWLQDDQPFYWIHGKPASGKSTLMKYIVQHENTKKALRQWKGTSHLATASFFFSHLGTALQRSQKGLLRSLLHDILKDNTWLMYHVMHDLCIEALKTKDQFLEEPSFFELKRWFGNLINLAHEEFKLFFVIDGLDEYDGNHQDLIQILRECSSPFVKILISSRPINSCRHAFKEYPQLRLQDLTAGDIDHYIRDRLGTQLVANGEQDFTPEQCKTLVDILIDKASGVFLWVVLTVQSVLDGHLNEDTYQMLLERVEKLPEDIKDLFAHILKRVPVEYSERSYRMLQLALTSLDVEIQTRGHPILALQLWFADDSWESVKAKKITQISRAKEIKLEDRLESRVLSRCCGLLELGKTKYDHSHPEWYDPITRATVRFLHKTAVEFLRDDSPELLMEMGCGSSFNAHHVLARSSLALAKHFSTKKIIRKWLGSSDRDGSTIMWDSMHNALQYAIKAQNSGSPLPTEVVEETYCVGTQLWKDVKRISLPGVEVPQTWFHAYRLWLPILRSSAEENNEISSLELVQPLPVSIPTDNNIIDVDIMALCCGLSSFLQESLRSRNTLTRQAHANYLLQCLNTLVWSSAPPGANQSNCFKVLFENGADPMTACHNLTVWTSFLDQIFGVEPDASKTALNDTFANLDTILDTFVHYGAPLAVSWDGMTLECRLKNPVSNTSWNARTIQHLNQLVKEKLPSGAFVMDGNSFLHGTTAVLLDNQKPQDSSVHRGNRRGIWSRIRSILSARESSRLLR